MDMAITQGRTKYYLFGPYFLSPFTVLNLTNSTVRLMVKPSAAAPDSSAIFDEKLVIDGSGAVTSPAGALTLGGVDTTVDPPVTYVGAASGVITLKWSYAMTNDAELATALQCELVVIDANDDPYTLYTGALSIGDALIDDPFA